ncbi:MAG TPA: plastocyanin/azurin family copper-binding protein, partial [Verrucomicrobiae bacterium]|nr:plastocyanin/azurin family copper-binding protein [Verrucomicrobiae bacterium]
MNKRNSKCPASLGCLLIAATFLGPSAFGATFTVSMFNPPTGFSPANLTINVGDTVTWRCVVGFHDTVAEDGAWNSNIQFPALMRPGNTFSVTFNSPGSHAYYCTPHRSLGMVGNITVLAPNSPPSVSIITPANQSSYAAPADISFEASPSDPNGDPVTVEFFLNGSSLGSLSTAPYRIAVNGLGPGNYTFTVTARDSAGAASSASSSVTVNGNQPSITTGPQ